MAARTLLIVIGAGVVLAVNAIFLLVVVVKGMWEDWQGKKGAG